MSEEKRDWFENPPPRRVGALALIMRGTQVLMVSRPYRVAAPQWGLPGVSARADEVPRLALSRLLDEGLSLRATTGRLLVVDHVPATPGLHHEGTNYVYEVHVPDDVEPVVTESGRLGDARWIERSKVRELAVDHALRRIERCLRAAETGQFEELLLGVPLHDSSVSDTPAA
ncbi:NUDIX domain-containing protein [Streptomyces sp. NPDC002676]